MEYYDVVFEGVAASDIDRLLKVEMNMSDINAVNSHLYDREKGDTAYCDSLQLGGFFSYANTGAILAGTLFLEKKYENVLILLSSDEDNVEVTLNISTDQLNISKNDMLYSFLKRIFKAYRLKCIYICDEYGMKENAVFRIK